VWSAIIENTATIETSKSTKFPLNFWRMLMKTHALASMTTIIHDEQNCQIKTAQIMVCSSELHIV
jgi:hypothetical protein